MGYDVSMTILEVIVPAAKVGAALQALHNLSAAPVSSFPWVDRQGLFQALEDRNLGAALGEWGYSCSTDERLSPVEQLALDTEFTDVQVNWWEQGVWGDDEVLWATLAPFIADDGCIEMRGEDGAYWRYRFVKGEMIEEHGTIGWQ